ncbi:hypothetical protein TNCV_68641 [Trichonephila clavipes]|nr:hypothetical protein TNCV_68641 [Trichonephila clavipes]
MVSIQQWYSSMSMASETHTVKRVLQNPSTDCTTDTVIQLGATRWFWVTDLIVLNHVQLTRTTPEQPPSPNYTPHKPFLHDRSLEVRGSNTPQLSPDPIH